MTIIRKGLAGTATTKEKLRSIYSLKWILWCLILCMMLWCMRFSSTMLENSASLEILETTAQKIVPETLDTPETNARDFSYWKDLALTLAGKDPKTLLEILRTRDPFGVRTFEERLTERESNLGRILTQEEFKELFHCPRERISLPDQRNTKKAYAFRNGTESYFLFFQHLRKAGGTNFCQLAKDNMEKKTVPPYYCMPDRKWKLEKRKGRAGSLSLWTNNEIVSLMKKHGHRIAANEWDPFDPKRFFILPAIFATSFRRPLDRAISQFRFECVEGRACKNGTDIDVWWKRRTDLTNVYAWTFSNLGIKKPSQSRSLKPKSWRQEAVGISMDTLAKFNLVTVMEWLAYAPQQIRDVLGFQNTTSVTRRVRPFNKKGKTLLRDDGQEENTLGAAGIAKASWTPKEYLSPELYETMSYDLALDEILNDVARRMFLERIVCDDVQQFN